MIKVKKLCWNAVLPTRAYRSAGYDLYTPEEFTIDPGQTVKVHLGIAMSFPDGYVGLIWDRSSMGSSGIHRFAGVIDCDYRGEWIVILHNTGERKSFKQGDRIAQVIFQKFEAWPVVEANELSDTERGEGGFGSTGK